MGDVIFGCSPSKLPFLVQFTYLFRCLHAMYSESMAVLTPIISYQMAIIRYNLVREREKMMHCLLYYH